MGTREMSPGRWRGGPAAAARALRSRWRTASLASGWPYPGDWAVPEVDPVCEAVVAGTDVEDAVPRLASARARAGSGLGETLRDVAALHAVLTAVEGRDGLVIADPDALPSRLLRVTAVAWSEVLLRQLAHSEVRDGLTGLSSTAYLRARLREVYRAGAHPQHVLVVFAPDLAGASGWSRLAAMVLLADVLRSVFDGGQTLAVLGPTIAAVLTERSSTLGEHTTLARTMVRERFAVDPQLQHLGAPAVWLETLPDRHESASRLLTGLGRL